MSYLGRVLYVAFRQADQVGGQWAVLALGRSRHDFGTSVLRDQGGPSQIKGWINYVCGVDGLITCVLLSVLLSVLLATRLFATGEAKAVDGYEVWHYLADWG